MARCLFAVYPVLQVDKVCHLPSLNVNAHVCLANIIKIVCGRIDKLTVITVVLGCRIPCDFRTILFEFRNEQ